MRAQMDAFLKPNAWKAKYGGMDVSEAREAKQLRDEITRLPKQVADLSLDKEAPQSAIRKDDGARSHEARCRAIAAVVCLQSSPSVSLLMVAVSRYQPRRSDEPQAASGRVGYSARSASTGFTDAARWAGMKLAARAAIPSTPATATNVGISQVRTPNSSFRISVAAPIEQIPPIAIPAAASQDASPNTIR